MTQTQVVPAAEAERPEPAPVRGPHRFWSSRRIPSAVVAAVVLVASGALLYDTVAVHGAHRRAGRWRRELADQLASRHLDDPWVLLGAAVAAVLGLWLLWLALSPGLRAVLPMNTPAPAMRAGLDRKAVALVLRDDVLRVSGVRGVRVKTGRRRIKVRVDVHFRDPAEVRRELEALLPGEVTGLGLTRPPRLTVVLREVNGG
ncbi:hypothetical protein AQ490_03670 [Wenjunlia vitaminophila]|uniref:DUF6286 domain-containing protein n=1 Tax=Wenjunlia vitaminophila TaxID=76728 RepID=A0A0T6LTD8_WENVI|nr:DUF6286 domain-containing protein [Wenjunlia vitaminophila]KRV49302.1 hypothetical protein AQ490_03670 [Wenjunlia vitaminophila]